jgi:hypothetical protein
MPGRFKIHRPGIEYQVSEYFSIDDPDDVRSGEYRAVTLFLTNRKALDYIGRRTRDSKR